jgi:conjugal transfer ATP-binding protein TraC
MALATARKPRASKARINATAERIETIDEETPPETLEERKDEQDERAAIEETTVEEKEQVNASEVAAAAKNRLIVKDRAKTKIIKAKETLSAIVQKAKNVRYKRKLRHMYKKLGIGTKRFVETENVFDSLPSERLASLTEREWDRLWRRNRLGDYLPYWVYDESEGVYFNNDNTFGVIFELAPRIHMSGDVSSSIVEILSKLPEKTIMQICFTAGSNNYWRLENWRYKHHARDTQEPNELLSTAVDNIGDFLDEKHREPICNAMQTRIKHNRLFFSLRGHNKEDVVSTANLAKDILGTNHFDPRVCHPSLLKPALYELLNGDVKPQDIPGYTDAKEINRQLIGGETEICFNHDHIRISAKANRKLEKAEGKYWVALTPQEFPEQAHIFDFGSKIGDKLSASLDSNQFNDNYIISATITKQPPNKTAAISRNHRFNMKLPYSEALFRVLANVRKESVEIVDRIDDKREPIFSFDLDVLVSGDSYDAAMKNATSIKSYWQKGGSESAIRLERIPDVNQLAFLAALPMGACQEYIDTCAKSFSLFGGQLAQFIPAEADFCGNGDNMMFITRRGALCGIDIFEMSENYNGFIVAGAGSGKSVLLQYLVFCSYARGDRIFALDIGRSQEKLCKTIGGQYLELDQQNPISFNPFTNIKTEQELGEELEFLTNFCYSLGANVNAKKAQEDEKLIKSYLGKAIKAVYAEKGNKSEVTDVKELMETKDDLRCKDFARQMSIYCREGIYERFFAGESQVDFGNDYIVAELQQIENDVNIRDPLIMMLIYHLQKSVFRDKSVNRKRLIVIIDEAHKFLGRNPQMDDFIEQAYRRYRKERASIIIATQGFSDIYAEGQLSKVGTAIINNSAWKFFLKQQPTSINLLIKSGTFSFTDYEEEALRSIKTVANQYSEIFLMTPSGMSVPVRLVIDRYFYYLTTSNRDDNKKIKEIAEAKNIGYSEAIKILIKREREAVKRKGVL